MLLTKEEKERLNALFYKLWSNRTGVKGSWGASRHCYHPTWIRRNGLLLKGETNFSSLYVLSPADCKVTPVYGDPRAQCSVTPIVDGEMISISECDDGIWWDILREELAKMEVEMEETIAKKRELARKEQEEKSNERLVKLNLASQSLLKN